jgi:UDP-N-acetylglucosamine:LPS N-acetylglucosamine transferase
MTKLKIVCMAVPEMGHFLPMVHIAEELNSRGHDVTFLTCQYNQKKCEQILSRVGVKLIVTNDGVERDSMIPGDLNDNPGAITGYRIWKAYIREELKKLNPDIAVIDFFTVPGF